MRTIFTIFYLLLIIFEVYTYQVYSENIHYFLDPIPILFLAVFYKTNLKNMLPNTIDRWLYGGLCFSVIGDLILINENLFVLGFLIFLGVYFCYFMMFREEGTRILFRNKTEFLKVLPFILIVFLYFGFTILTKIEVDLLILGVAYTFLVLLLILITWIRQSTKLSYYSGVLSAWAFGIASAVYSFKYFNWSFTFDDELTAIFYLLAQYFVVVAVLEHRKLQSQI